MKRWVLFTLTFTLVSTVAAAQAVVTPYGQATTGGIAVPVAPYVSPPLVTTPLMHLSNAATLPPTNTAAVSLTSPPPEPPSAVPIRPEIDLGPETVYVGPPWRGTDNSAANTAASPVTFMGRHYVDLGVNSGGAMAFNDGTSGRSLGEIARENRQRMQGVNARTFTNSDVEHMAGAGGVSGIATNPSNNAGYPADNGVINSSGAIAAPTNPPAQNAPQATPPATEQKPSAAVPPHEMTQAQTPANPADQNAQSNAASANQQGNQRTLPKSASPLPLIALGGFTATIAGLLARKARA